MKDSQSSDTIDDAQARTRCYNHNDLEIFNLLKHPVWVFDYATKCMYWANIAALNVWNANSLESLLSRDFASDMSAATDQRIKDYMVRFETAGEVIQEYWTLYPNGVATTLGVTHSGIRIDDGRLAILAEGERPDIQTSIDHSTLRGIEMLRHLPLAVSQFDIHGQLEYQNPASFQTFGHSEITSITETDTEIEIDTETETETEIEIETDTNKNKNTKQSTTATTTAAEKSQQQQQQQVDNNNNDNDMDSDNDDDGPVNRTNKRLSRMCSHEENNVFLKRFVDRELARTVFQKVKQGEDYNVETEQYTKDGSTRWFSIAARRANDPVTSGHIILYSARDITDVIKAREETQRASLKSEFMSVMAHEIRTPLHQIVGYLDLLEVSAQLTTEHRKTIKMVQSSVALLMTIIDDLLNYSKIENGKLQIENTCFATNNVLNLCTKSVQTEANEKGILIKSHFAPDVPPKLMGDPNRLRQILLNLLNNAVKFTDRGHVELIVRQIQSPQLSLSNNSNDAQESMTDESANNKNNSSNDNNKNNNNITWLRFEVSDTGIGISPIHQEKVFEKYRQANRSITRNYGGTGLGLAICKALAEGMGGNIGLVSVLDQGTTVSFELPFELPAPEDSIDEAEQELVKPITSAKANKTSSTLRILVAEDNKINQKVVRSMLQRIGHQVTVAENGQIAVDELKRGHFDLVLMDVQMPVMDGIEATKEIRNMGKTKTMLPVVGLTASFQHSDLSYYLEVGMNNCIGKPVRLDHLRRVINSANNDNNDNNSVMDVDDDNDNTAKTIPANSQSKGQQNQAKRKI